MPFTVFDLKHKARRLLLLAATLALSAAAATSSQAQSIDPNSPTPIVSNEVTGRIAPLDIGDARSTRFFYTFNGLPGDLELTVESFNLEGDVDIFLAGNMRPLTKVTLYAGATANTSTKTAYLRRDEPLILRVQARTPNDVEGTYRIRLGGAFRPSSPHAAGGAAPGEPANAQPGSTATGGNRNVRRVSSVGARIEEPVAEVAKEAAKEEPAAPAVATPTPSSTAARKTPANPRPARTRAGARRTSRAETTRKNPPRPEAVEGDTAKGEATNPDKGNDAAREEPGATERTARPERARPVRVPRARNNRNSTTARRTDAPPAEPLPESPANTNAPPAPASARLVLVMRDGETFERDMAGIRRVTVENGVLVIVSKTGKTERQPMNAVLRMSIEP